MHFASWSLYYSISSTKTFDKLFTKSVSIILLDEQCRSLGRIDPYFRGFSIYRMTKEYRVNEKKNRKRNLTLYMLSTNFITSSVSMVESVFFSYLCVENEKVLCDIRTEIELIMVILTILTELVTGAATQ